MHYIIYKTTNLINGKFYIGKHQTKNLNDGYVGSGKLLKRAINKYGIDNFHTEIIEIYDEEWKMNIAEKILVVLDSELSYNICRGGDGSFSFVNKVLTKEKRSKMGKNGAIYTNNIILEKYGVSCPSKIEFVKEKISNSLKETKKIQYDQEILDKALSVDFSKRGWTRELSKIINQKNSGRWLKKYYPELVKNAWRKTTRIYINNFVSTECY